MNLQRFSKGGRVKKLIDRLTGRIINPGDKIKTFDDEEYIFEMISKMPGGGSGGKIIVRDPTVPEGEVFATREFYPSVFEAELAEPELVRKKKRGGRVKYAQGGKVKAIAALDEAKRMLKGRDFDTALKTLGSVPTSEGLRLRIRTLRNKVAKGKATPDDFKTLSDHLDSVRRSTERTV